MPTLDGVLGIIKYAQYIITRETFSILISKIGKIDKYCDAVSDISRSILVIMTIESYENAMIRYVQD